MPMILSFLRVCNLKLKKTRSKNFSQKEGWNIQQTYKDFSATVYIGNGKLGNIRSKITCST